MSIGSVPGETPIEMKAAITGPARVANPLAITAKNWNYLSEYGRPTILLEQNIQHKTRLEE